MGVKLLEMGSATTNKKRYEKVFHEAGTLTDWFKASQATAYMVCLTAMTVSVPSVEDCRTPNRFCTPLAGGGRMFYIGRCCQCDW